MTLFGPADVDEWVLRHRETGIVVTAYAGENGPSFGGGQGIDPDRWPQEAAMFRRTASTCADAASSSALIRRYGG